jgi:hypothetical protein
MFLDRLDNQIEELSNTLVWFMRDGVAASNIALATTSWTDAANHYELRAAPQPG